MTQPSPYNVFDPSVVEANSSNPAPLSSSDTVPFPNEELFRLLLGAVQDYAIFMLDPEGRVVSWNAGAEKIKGYSAKEIIGKHFSQFYTPEDLAAKKTDRELEVAVREGKYEEEGWRVRKDGTRFWANVLITTIRDPLGKHLGFSKVTRDITERRESDRIKSIVDNVVDGIVTFDENGVIESFNPAAERIFGYQGDEILGQQVSLLIPKGTFINWSPSERDGRMGESTGVRKDGSHFDVDISIGPFNFQGRRAYTAVIRDSTEKKRAQEQLLFYAQELKEKNSELVRSNQELDDFAYIASHDLKEPLRGIHNYATFLLEDYGAVIAEDGKDKLHTLRRLAQRMEALIDSLLQFSRVGRVELSTQPTDFEALIQSTLEPLNITLKEEHAEVRIIDALPVLRCDKVRVGEVFHNLIINGIKYNDKDKKIIEIGLDHSQSVPTIYVKDNGIGIPSRHHDVVFRIFKRLHGRDQFGGGTGAGLTIVKKIVERHGGRVWLTSEVGKGTTFFFTLMPEPNS